MDDAKPSKSARKRDHLALQVLGEKLIPLELDELDRLDLDEPLFEAVVRAKRIRSPSALRRQRQLIGKLMREADADAIESALHKLGRQDRATRQRFRDAERWRDRVCTNGATAAAEFMQLVGGSGGDLEGLRRELTAAKSESARRSVRRRIFREIYRKLATPVDTPSLQREPDEQ